MIAKELYLDNKGNYLYLLLKDNIRIPVWKTVRIKENF